MITAPLYDSPGASCGGGALLLRSSREVVTPLDLEKGQIHGSAVAVAREGGRAAGKRRGNVVEELHVGESAELGGLSNGR